MRPGQVRAFIAGILTGAAIATGTIIVAAPARADDGARAWAAEYGPTVCDQLANRPTLAGLMAELEDVSSAGYTAEQSGQLVAESVLLVCPRYTPLLRQFVAVFGGRTLA